jgi:hypothetical protein
LRLRHRFNELLDGSRQEIAQKMGLTLGQIRETPASTLVDLLIARAEQEDQLMTLWSEVEKGHNQPDRANPYGEEEHD